MQKPGEIFGTVGGNAATDFHLKILQNQMVSRNRKQPGYCTLQSETSGLFLRWVISKAPSILF